MENAIIERVQNQFYNLKVLSDELRVQMALGQAEAKDLIENEKKVLSKYFSSQKKNIEHIAGKSENVRKEFLHSIQDLEIDLFKEVPTKKAEYATYKSALLSKVYSVEESIKENYPQLKTDLKNILDPFKTKMDAFRVNLALHDKDNPEKVESIRAEFSQKLDQVRSLLTKKEDDQSKIDSFVEDISTSFDFLKKALDRLN